MTRLDWLWLAVKLLGLWLLIEGARLLPVALAALFNWPGFREVLMAFVSAGWPMVLGLFLIRGGFAFVSDSKS